MPIIRRGGVTAYFSHTPKCGGTSIEIYLRQFSGVHIALLDPAFYEKPSYMRLSPSTPQHLSGLQIAHLFPVNFFDVFFSIVRDPVERFRSAFVYHKMASRMIHADTEINEFIANIEVNQALKNGYFDNHFLPQAFFLYPRAPYKIFKFEDGLADVKRFADDVILRETSSLSMPHANRSRLSDHEKKQIQLSAESHQILRTLYKIDYEIFGY